MNSNYCLNRVNKLDFSWIPIHDSVTIDLICFMAKEKTFVTMKVEPHLFEIPGIKNVIMFILF